MTWSCQGLIINFIQHWFPSLLRLGLGNVCSAPRRKGTVKNAVVHPLSQVARLPERVRHSDCEGWLKLGLSSCPAASIAVTPQEPPGWYGRVDFA